MLEMITFWLSYGVLTVIWWGFIVYWGIKLLDLLIERWTDGDCKDAIFDKLVAPFLQKFGLANKVDVSGDRSKSGKYRYMFNPDFYPKNNRLSAVLVFWVTAVGSVFSMFVTLVSTYDDNLYTLHEVTVKISNFAAQHLTLPILIVTTLVLLDGVIRKVYKFGKKAKIALDKLDTKQ
jgi:hypothetical protein